LRRYAGHVPDIRSADYHVAVRYDDDSGVWLATSQDVIGLTLEYDSLDHLQAQILPAVAEMLELNDQPPVRQVTVTMTRQLAYPARGEENSK